MSLVSVTESSLENIAAAIRNKKGGTDTYTPGQMAGAINGIHTADEVVLVQKSITENGTYNPAGDSADGYSGVSVDVANSYTTEDNGKVVSNQQLVAQTSKQITQNGTHDTTTNNSVSVAVPNSYSASDNGKVVVNQALVAQTSKNINANGTHDTTANNSVVVDVPNSYSAADEGKVVSGGALVAQTSRTITNNGTYDTKTNNQVIVAVDGGGGGGVLNGLTPPSNSIGSIGEIYIQKITHGILKSDGLSYIDIGEPVTPKSKIRISAKLEQDIENYDTLFGCRSGRTNRFTARFAKAQSSGKIDFHKSLTANNVYVEKEINLTKSQAMGGYYVYELQHVCLVENVQIESYGYTNDDTDYQYNLYLFANNDAGTAGDFGEFSIKYAKIWNGNDELVHFLIPYTDNNDIPCVYDMITGNYLYNSGNGDFEYLLDTLIEEELIWEKTNVGWIIKGGNA
jgi:hypothetical protein